MRKGLLVCCFSLVSATAFAGESTLSPAAASITASPTPDPTWTFGTTTAYTGSARIMKAEDFGSQANVEYELQAYKNVKLFQNYFLQLGFDLDRINFSRSNSLFPYALTSLAGEIKFAYWDGDDFSPGIQLGQGSYNTRDTSPRTLLIFPFGSLPGSK